MKLTYTTREGVRHPLELVRRHDMPRFFVVRSQRTNEVLHLDAGSIEVDGQRATAEGLDDILNPRRS